MLQSVCLNCGNENPPENKFCAQCGQKTETHRISLHEVVHDAIHYFTHADKGIFYLLRRLLTSPGVVAREYLAGRRTHYFKPLNFYLLVAAVLVFMTSKFNPDTTDESPRVRSERTANSPKLSEGEIAKYKAMSIRKEKVSQFTSKYSNVINMLATPLIAFFFLLFYLKGPYRYMEHLVANMYIVAFIMLFYSLLIVPLAHFNTNPSIKFFLYGIFFLFEIVYRGVAYYQLMNQPGKKYLFKAIGISVLLTIVWVAGISAFTWYYIVKGF